MKELVKKYNEEKQKLWMIARSMDGAIKIQNDAKKLTGESHPVQDAIEHLAKVRAKRALQ